MSLYAAIEFPGHPDLENVRRLDLLAIPMIRRAQRLGIAIDKEYFADLSARFAREAEAVKREIADYIPPDKVDEFTSRSLALEEAEEGGDASINPASAEQVGKLLWDVLGLGADKRLKRTSKGAVSTGKRSLELVKGEHPVVARVLRYRELTKLRTTYSDKLPALARFHPRSACCPVCELAHETDQWRVHGEMGTTRAETGRINHKNPNCFSRDTEVLTPKGWVRFDELAPDSEVAQWEFAVGAPAGGGMIRFVKPTGRVQYFAERLIWNHTEDQIDLLTTSDHRCLLQNQHSNNWFIYHAEDYPEDYRQWNSGEHYGSGVEYTDAMLAFLIAMQADGSWSRRAIDFAFKKQRKIRRLTRILEELGVRYTSHQNGEGRIRFYISAVENEAFVERVKQLLGTEKRLPIELFISLNKAQAAVAMKEFMQWDGDSVSENKYASIDKHNADVVATLFTLNGRRAAVRARVNTAGCHFWSADVSRNGYSLTTNRQQDVVPYSDDVYCVSVPSTILLVRRNGKVHVTGNCGNIPTRTEDGQLVQAGFIAPPGKRLINRDLSQIELRDLAHLANCQSMIQVYLDGGDIHDDTCHRALGVPWDQKPDKIKHRMAAKRTNFSIQNGGTEKGLYMQLVMDFGASKIPVPDWLTEEWCRKFIEEWLDSRPEVRLYFERCWYRARRYGMVWDGFGRIRLVPEVASTHAWIREAGLRQAQNMSVTSTAAGHLKLSMGKVNDMLEDLYADGVWCWPLLTIHDAIMAEAEEDYADVVCEGMGMAMETCMNDEMSGKCVMRVPITSDGDVMERWMKQ